MKLCTVLVVFGVASLIIAYHAAAQPPTKPNYFAEDCQPEYGKYTANSTYESDLKAALTILGLLAKTDASSNTSSGSGKNTVYGLYYCRADISIQLCSDCVEKAELSIKENCPNAIAAVMYYEECTLRYANQSMMGIEAVDPGYHLWGVANVTDPDMFSAVLNDTRDKVVQNASYESESLHYATGEGVVSPSETVYLLAQCSPDLEGQDCDTCLGSAFEFLERTDSGGEWPQYSMVFVPSCQIRYSVHGAFYPLPNSTTVSPALSPLQPDPQAPVLVNLKPPSTSPAATNGNSCFLLYAYWFLIRRRAIEAEVEDSELQNTVCVQFDLKTLEAATNSFSVSSKLGQGGFGIVYQGILNDGQEIAVKRLSKNSGQGAKEFKTEVAVVAKLQHRNLVQLVGFCVDREERLLVYEFLHNLSLDRFLYDAIRAAYLTWAIRHKIILGIARGLHYLHEDSRVRIVHRDLKTSNILLDDSLEPKIADFGLAKLVEMDQTSNNTTKVVGTYGYMSPEYALAGRYSTKSDVYSFGVILHEIFSGKFNNRFYEISEGRGLLSYAWSVWNEGAIEKLLDPILQNNYSKIEAERCLQIGLLCVQDDEANRPPMHAVLVMLNNNSSDLPPPFTPSHSMYINKLSLGDDTQERTSKQHQNDYTKSSITTSEAEKDLYTR